VGEMNGYILLLIVFDSLLICVYEEYIIVYR